MSAPKILLFDIETSHNIVAVFQLAKNDYIDPSNILAERYVISASWKWLNEKKTHAVSVLDDEKRFKDNPNDDLHVLKTLHGVLSEADVIVGHNSDKFDIKYLEARMLINGLPALPPIVKIDTLKIAKKRFLFNSNKLDYLGKVLGVGRKIKTSGGLWLKALKGDKLAIKKMVEYNKGDVLLLERVFLKLRPFITIHIAGDLFGGTGCPKCGSSKLQSRGIARTATRVYQRMQCQSCGGWSRRLKAEPTPCSIRSI